jgi:hypothetical protein
MRMLSIAAMLAVLTVAVGATLNSRPVSRALASAEGYVPPTVGIDRLTANANDLPVQSFDAF